MKIGAMCLYGNRIQRFAEYPIYKRKRVSAFIIDETVIQIGNQSIFVIMILFRTNSS